MPAWLPQDWCSSFVLALGHFLWQGTLIAIALAIALRVVQSVSARYWLALAALLLLTASPLLTFVWLVWPASPLATADVAPAVREMVTAMEDPVSAAHVADAARFLDEPALPGPTEVGPRDLLPGSAPDSATADELRWLPRFAPQLTSLYLACVSLLLLRLAMGLWGGRRLRRRATPVTDTLLLTALRRQADALGLKLRPALAYCERVSVPTVIGVLKPMILLPLALASGLSPRQIESVLAHELGHLRRYDHLVNLLQRVIESLLFFHPAVWWVSYRVRQEREHCCDDLVVACGAMPLDYAQSLLRVAELSQASRLSHSVAAVSLLATGGKPSNLRLRIARLLGDAGGSGGSRLYFRSRWPAALLGMLLIGISSLLSLTWNLAAKDEPKSEMELSSKLLPEKNADEVPHGPVIELVGGGKNAAPTRLQVRNADGSRAQFQDVVIANVGFPRLRFEHWVGSPDREGIVSLEKLPAGTHWLLVGGQALSAVKLPTDEPILERRLRAARMRPAMKAEIGRQPIVQIDDDAGEVVVIDILNESQEMLTVSEEDVHLKTMVWERLYRCFSPRWRSAEREPFPLTKIEAGQTGQLRLNWREWATRGLWALREHETITEPVWAPPAPGKVCVCVVFGNTSTLAVTVTDPVDLKRQTSVDPAPEQDDKLKKKVTAQPIVSDLRKNAAAVPGDPRPATARLKISYDIPGAAAQATFHLHLAEHVVPEITDAQRQRDVRVQNGGSVELTDLLPGRYQISRAKPINFIDFERRFDLDYRMISIGRDAATEFVVRRGTGKRVRGTVAGLSEAVGNFSTDNGDLNGDKRGPSGTPTTLACVLVRNASTPALESDFVADPMRYDVAPCQPDGSFVTDPLEPGTYRLDAQVFRRLTEVERRSSGVITPAWVGSVVVRVPADNDPEPVSITLERFQFASGSASTGPKNSDPRQLSNGLPGGGQATSERKSTTPD